MADINRASFDVNNELQVECIRIGQEQEPLVKVDSFLRGVDELKRYAVEVNDFAIADSYYPGIRMAIPALYTAAVAKHLSNYIEGFFGLNLKKVQKAISRYSIVTFPPEKLNILQRIPHFDAPSRNSLAMVHYLCDAPDSGTSFYRHRELGYEYVDSIRHKKYTCHIRQQFLSPEIYPCGYIAGDTPEFEKIMSVQAVYNRLIMYPGSSLHSGIIRPGYTCDPNPATGRLTITTFIEFAD